MAKTFDFFGLMDERQELFEKDTRLRAVDLSAAVGGGASVDDRFARKHVHTAARDGFNNEVYSFSPDVGTHVALVDGTPGHHHRAETACVLNDLCLCAAETGAGGRQSSQVVDNAFEIRGLVVPESAQRGSLDVAKSGVFERLQGAILVAPLKMPSMRCVPCRVAQLLTREPATRVRLIADCTQTLDEMASFYPGGSALVRCPAATECLSVTMGCDVGTHVDSPSHFFDGGRRVSDLRMDELVAPAWLLDVRCAVRGAGPDYAVTVADILASEEAFGRRIPRGAIVAVLSGFDRLFGSAAYMGEDGAALHFPGVGVEAAEFLLRERQIAGIGIDTLSLDRGVASDFPVHQLLLGNDIFQVENMRLQELAEWWGQRGWKDQLWFAVMPWAVRGAFECVARVVALAVE